MLRNIREALEKRDEGFTLIELLVVVIIIGILAAVAIPVFLNQREKAWDSAAKSDVKNMATAQETYLTENDVYTNDVDTNLVGQGFSKSSNVLHDASNNGGSDYQVCASHTSSTAYFTFDSTTGQTTEGTLANAGDTPNC